MLRYKLCSSNIIKKIIKYDTVPKKELPPHQSKLNSWIVFINEDELEKVLDQKPMMFPFRKKVSNLGIYEYVRISSKD